METINATETMKTITDTKGELVNIINGLYGVQSLKGKKISIMHSDATGASSATASKIHFLVINNS